MSSISTFMYTLIPTIALVCNIFLFCTLLTAKKDKSIWSFMLMMLAFVLWAAGSLFCRSQIWPGTSFWWTVSLTGLFLVPYLLFLVVFHYTEQKGFLAMLIWGIITVVIVVMNILGLFITKPFVGSINGHPTIRYTATWLAIIPVIYAVLILLYSAVIVLKASKKSGMPLSYMAPLGIGVLFMIAGVILDLVPIFNSLPLDTLGCAINSICIYYSFYKKRLYSLQQMTSSGGVYVITVLVMALFAPQIMNLSMFVLSGRDMNLGSVWYTAIVASVALAVVVYVILNKLNDALFIKEQNRKELVVKEFSDSVKASLKVDEIINETNHILMHEVAAEHIYICLYSEENRRYERVDGTSSLEAPIYINKTNPLIEYLTAKDNGCLYHEFQRSKLYKGMWEEEKRALEFYNVTYILPFKNDKEVMGFALFANKSGRKTYSYTDISFMESVGAIASIAIKNAYLYTLMEKEAQLDALTNIYNRRYFTKELSKAVNEGKNTPVSLVMFSLDDFSLYNELYGQSEGDQMLKRFAGILTSVFGTRGVIARYGGKEFCVLLPGTDSDTAMSYAKRVKKNLADSIVSESENTKRFLTFSAGICSYPSVANSANELITFVNLAIFKLKQTGKNQISIYTENFGKDVDVNKDKREHIYELTSTIYALTAAIDAKDHYTFNHSRCVSEYATKLAGFAGLPEDYVEIIRQAGLLHDIGKISIPDAILTKQGKLSNEEFNIMRQHVERSIEMIRHLPSLDYVIPAVVGHHERYDGTGYPRGISGEDIPIGARCLAIADSFDAMISKRSYKDKMSIEISLNEILMNLGTQFDPKLGKLFVEKVKSGEIEVIDY